MAKRRVASAARKAALLRTAERGAARRAARETAQLARSAANRERTARGELTPWQEAKALRAKRRGHVA